MHSFSKLSVGGLSTSVEISRILSHLGGMRHLMIWVHCHSHMLSTPAVSWLVAAQCLWHLLKLFWCSGDTTARALLTDMSTRSREVQSTLVAGPGLSSPALAWRNPGPSEVHGFYGTISPALHRESSQIRCLPHLQVPGCVCDEVGISSLFLWWPLQGCVSTPGSHSHIHHECLDFLHKN